MAGKKLIKKLHMRLAHDPMSYSSKWKWEWLPDDVREGYSEIRPTLLKWQELGCITLVEDDRIVFEVHSVPPVP